MQYNTRPGVVCIGHAQRSVQGRTSGRISTNKVRSTRLPAVLLHTQEPHCSNTALEIKNGGFVVQETQGVGMDASHQQSKQTAR